MSHNTTEVGMIVTFEIDFPLLMHVHNSVRAPIHVVAYAAVVRTVQDKRILDPRIVVGWAISRERESRAACVGCKRVRKSTVGIFIAFFFTTS